MLELDKDTAEARARFLEMLNKAPRQRMTLNEASKQILRDDKFLNNFMISYGGLRLFVSRVCLDDLQVLDDEMLVLRQPTPSQSEMRGPAQSGRQVFNLDESPARRNPGPPPPPLPAPPGRRRSRSRSPLSRRSRSARRSPPRRSPPRRSSPRRSRSPLRFSSAARRSPERKRSRPRSLARGRSRSPPKARRQHGPYSRSNSDSREKKPRVSSSIAAKSRTSSRRSPSKRHVKKKKTSWVVLFVPCISKQNNDRKVTKIPSLGRSFFQTWKWTRRLLSFETWLMQLWQV